MYRWDTRITLGFYTGVTITTIDAEIASVKFVTVVNGLSRSVSNFEIFGRKVIPNKSNKADCPENCGNGKDGQDFI